MMKYLKKTGCLLIIFLAVIGIAFYPGLFSDNMERRTVTVGFFEYPPYGMTDPGTGRPTGYYVDILEAIAKSQNLEIKYINTFLSDYRDSIPKGEPYVMGLPVIITQERQRICNFSWPCNENDTILVMKKGSSVKKISDLKSRVIGAVKGVRKDYCKKMYEEGKIKSYKWYDSTVKLYAALTAGEIDAVIINRNIALYFQGLHPDVFALTDFVLFDQYEYEGFPIQKKQKWLLKRINAGLRRIMNSSEYSRIYRKYFPNEGDWLCN
ncbi:MAG: transporter substrate-binding domain-containing protein [Victivallales bacterium]|nr:transporter substrate-binding domain-containing protein [Victivallales bacterium]